MVIIFCGDDCWLLCENCLFLVQVFKDWIDCQCLCECDLMQGLLIMLVYEVYIYGEVEYIYLLYKEWFSCDMGVFVECVCVIVVWVMVYIGGIESNYFVYVMVVVNVFVEVMEIEVNEEVVCNLFGFYLCNKVQVMCDCVVLF